MTKLEFYDYIKSFNKNPGEYTDDEVYDICIQHKSLPQGDKNWREVVELLGVDRTPDGLRNWTFRRQEADGTVKRNVKLLTDKTVSDLSPDEAKENFDKQLQEIYIAKTQVRDTWNAYRRSLRDEARVRSMTDSLVEAIGKLGKLSVEKFVDYEDLGETSKEAVLLLSDLHIGVNCDNYYNTYNSDIAAIRLANLVKGTIKYCKSNNVSKLHIINLGDMIQGLIHTNARLEQELDVTEQIMVASELVALTINSLNKEIPCVTYRSVLDNHSRAMANLSEHIEKENFNRLVDWYVQERLKDSDVEFIDDNIDGGIGMFTLENGKKVMFSHGHLDKKSSIVQDMIGLTREWIDYIFLGHYHNCAEHTFQGTKVYVNGSICGTEQYAFGRRLFGDPAQKLLIFDDDNVMNIDIVVK